MSVAQVKNLQRRLLLLSDEAEQGLNRACGHELWRSLRAGCHRWRGRYNPSRRSELLVRPVECGSGTAGGDRLTSSRIDQTEAVEQRYGAAAQSASLVSAHLLASIPACWRPFQVLSLKGITAGDPTRWVRCGDRVLDLGSGSGKNAFICAQVVGAEGSVIGVDRNAEMLQLSRSALADVAAAIGYTNVQFIDGTIEALDAPGPSGRPLIDDASIDVVLSNCVLNLVNPAAWDRLLSNICRVLAPAGRIAISDIICDQPVPVHLQQDPELERLHQRLAG